MTQLRSVSAVLDAAAAQVPDRPALVDDDVVTTFSELRTSARRLAVGLRRLGVGRGDHVAVWMHNGADFVRAFYATAYLDAVLVPMNTWHKREELAYALSQSDARILIAGPLVAGSDPAVVLSELLPNLKAADQPRQGFLSADFPQLRCVVLGGAGIPGAVPLASLFNEMDVDLDAVAENRGQSPAYISYTSGTTGKPKGVVLTAAGVLSNAQGFGERLGLGSGDHYYCAVPLFHAGGAIFVLLAAHIAQATVVTHQQFSPDAALDAIIKYDCQFLGGFEVTYLKLLAAVEERSLNELPLRAGWWAGGPPTAFKRIESRMGLTLMNLYGLTEAHGNVTSTPLNWPADQRATCHGVVLSGRELTIADPFTGEDLAPGEIGEIRVGGWGLTPGYYRKPVETAAKFDERGRLRTGDLGSVTHEGCLHFVCRMDDALKVGGENVAPLEIEEVLLGHDAVDEVMVVGVPDPTYGQVPLAVVRLRAGTLSSEDELCAFAKSHLSSFKVPRRILFVDEFPRTSTGKICKQEVVSLLATEAS